MVSVGDNHIRLHRFVIEGVVHLAVPNAEGRGHVLPEYVAHGGLDSTAFIARVTRCFPGLIERKQQFLLYRSQDSPEPGVEDVGRLGGVGHRCGPYRPTRHQVPSHAWPGSRSAAYPWVMPAVGELVRCTDGRWMIRPPQHCPRGHRLSPRRVLVGHRVCSCGGRPTWTCGVWAVG